MKITCNHLIPWAMAVVCLNVAGLAPLSTSRETAKNTPLPTEDSPSRFNRASGLIGMKICNQKEDQLGKVKDIVFDLQTERVAYVVMAVNTMGIRSFTEKLMAVPLTALTPSSDNTYLVLPADKEKIDLAAGFDPNNWPSASNASWGAQPSWQEEQSGNKEDEQTPKPETNPDDK